VLERKRGKDREGETETETETKTKTKTHREKGGGEEEGGRERDTLLKHLRGVSWPNSAHALSVGRGGERRRGGEGRQLVVFVLRGGAPGTTALPPRAADPSARCNSAWGFGSAPVYSGMVRSLGSSVSGGHGQRLIQQATGSA
jgi:hypothetical protein